MKEISHVSKKSVLLTAAACALGLTQTVTSFAPVTRMGSPRSLPGSSQPRSAIILNNDNDEPPTRKVTTIISDEESSDSIVSSTGARLKADNIFIEKLVPGKEEALNPIDDKMTVEEAVNIDLLGSASQEPEDVPLTQNALSEDESLPFTTDILAGVDQAKLMDPAEVLNSVIGPDPSIMNDVDLSEAFPNSDNNDDHAPFTSDILAGVDQTKLMDPAEVLKAVIEPAFSDDLDESIITPPPVDEIVSVTTESGLNQPLLETVTEISLPDLSEEGPVSTSEINKPHTEKQADKSVSLTEDQSIDIPGVRDIFRFAIPAIGVWLCSPLLSLIDTSAVGLLSGTAQQAALNPAVAVTDYSALLVAFMYTATTNLIAAAKEKDSQVEGKPLSTRTLVTSLQLSGLVGTVLGSGLILSARTLLRAIIGNDSIDPAVFNAAMKYVRIRAIGMPAAVIIGSAQSACLGLQDIRSPLYVLFAAAVVNFLGDCIFVGSSSSLFGGAAGAAWATVFSQYAALGMFLKWLTSKKNAKETPQPGQPVDVTRAILELTSDSKGGKPRRKKFRKALRSFQDNSDALKIPKVLHQPISKILKHKEPKSSDTKKKTKKPESTRGFLSGKFSPLDFFKLPTLERSKQFWPYVIPVTTTSVGRVSSYVAMSYVVSSALGTAGMAAQQIIVSLFYCLTPVADSLNLTAQTFVPGIFEKKKSAARAAALKNTMFNFMKSAGIFGVLLAAATTSIPLVTGFFTADMTVISQVNSVIPYLASCFLLHGYITAGEGLLLGQKDLGFLGKAYASFFVAVPYFMLRVKHLSQIGTKAASLTSVWQVFLGYQVVRAALFIARLLQIQRETYRKVEGTV